MPRRVRHTTSRRSKQQVSKVLREDEISTGAPKSKGAARDPANSRHADTLNNVVTSASVNRMHSTSNGLQNDGNDSDQSGPVEQVFKPLGVENSEFIFAESFDEAGYLRLNPDVKRAIEAGQIESGYAHYLWHGRAENRPLPNTPRESRNVMLTSPVGSARSEVFAKEARCAIDALIIAPKGGLMIVGWIDDVTGPLSCIRITGADWRVVIDSSRYLRVRRMDVENAVGGRRLHAFGFIGFIYFDQGGDGSGPIKIELWQEGGFSTALQCTAAFVESLELRDTVLAHLAAASFFGNSNIESMRGLDRGMGAELVRFNKSITRRIVATPYVQRFGPKKSTPRGTIVVCLYGKPEFFFLQSCLYSGLPGIEDYEFIYVSNSPEMAETLLCEARSADLIYGLNSTVMILPGNAGFGAANNAAARIARSDRLLIVNPDVFPRDRDWAQKHTDLLAARPPEQTQLFGVPLYYDDGSLMHGGMYFEVDVGLSLSNGSPSPMRICRTQHYGKGAPNTATQFTRPRPVPAVTGAFISIQSSWFEQLGGFTEDFIFGHYEDADLCLKSIAKGTAPWLHDIRMWHLEGKGSTRQPLHEGGSLVNRWLFSKTWMSMIDENLTGPAPGHELMQVADNARAQDSYRTRRKFGLQGRVGQ